MAKNEMGLSGKVNGASVEEKPVRILKSSEKGNIPNVSF